ncbi:hypothetical protein PIB30_070389 [Stylosanthes scabra]|uniref:Uncharacterized protein n=1 Tax=Stylosanthes scabra TaxID=79078 RepID=A0ABU6QN17_9FABA|nr:hypothetical protein [Stylosanthes scabra]
MTRSAIQLFYKGSGDGSLGDGILTNIRSVSSLFVMRPPAPRRGLPRTVRPFAPDHFIPAIPPPRPAPPRPLPQPLPGVPHRRVPFATATKYRRMFIQPVRPPPPPSSPVADILDDVPSEPSQDLSADASNDRETSIEMSQSQSFASEASVGGSTYATSSHHSYDDPMD